MGRIDKVPTARRRTITNKTRLRFVEGDVPAAELVLLEEDDNKHKSLDIDTAGVEHEDAKVRTIAPIAPRYRAPRPPTWLTRPFFSNHSQKSRIPCPLCPLHP